MPSKTLSRRDFLRLGGLATTWAALMACAGSRRFAEWTVTPAVPGVGSPNAAPGLELTPAPARTAAPTAIPAAADHLLLHTLRRMYFGFTPADLEHAQKIGLQALIDEQLDYASLDDRQAERLVSGLDILQRSPEELLAPDTQRGQVVSSLVLATLVRHTFSQRRLYEMMVDFWDNHFSIYARDGIVSVLKIYDDRDVTRSHALGTFQELLQASAHSPAMLSYLDQDASTKEAPNENYARELLELHTLGVDGGYTQQDVQETARLLTGWGWVGPRRLFARANAAVGSFLFRPPVHDSAARSILGLEISAGRGQKGGEDFMDFLAAHPSAARFIAHKLAVRFVADEPPASIVDALAETYQNSAGDIPSLLHTLIAAPEFVASAKTKLKRPLEFIVSMLIASQAKITLDRRSSRAILEQMRLLGQSPHLWPAPNGYPDHASWWTTSSGMLNRWNLALQVMNGLLPGIRVSLKDLTADAQSAEDLVDVLSRQFLGEPLPSDGRDLLVTYIAEGDKDRDLPNLAALILASPYFQMR